MKLNQILFLLTFLGCGYLSFAQQTIELYNGEIPNSKNIEGVGNLTLNVPNYGEVRIIVVNPSITAYLPDKKLNSGVAVVICPGGAYFAEATGSEGTALAKRLCDAGIAGIVLNYRLPNPAYFKNKEYVPLQDAQQAMILVRQHAKDWGIDPNKIGIAGSSAGGHLASTAGTHFQTCYVDNPNNFSVRPDFMILSYPVISMADSLAHFGSRYSLIGPGLQLGGLAAQQENPGKEEQKYRDAQIPVNMINEFSNELHVSPNTPPTFIIHALDDNTVKIDNSILFIAALQQAGVEVKPFFYTKGGHGFGINNTTAKVQWISECIEWINNLSSKSNVK